MKKVEAKKPLKEGGFTSLPAMVESNIPKAIRTHSSSRALEEENTLGRQLCGKLAVVQQVKEWTAKRGPFKNSFRFRERASGALAERDMA